MRLHADGVDRRVGPTARCPLADLIADVPVELRVVDGVDLVAAGKLEPLGDRVDADHPRAAAARDACRHLADWPEAEHRDRAARRRVGVLDRLPGGGEDVGEVDEALVRRPLGHLDRAEVALRDPQRLGLAAGDLAVELRVAEKRCALVLLVHLRRLALRVEPLLTHPAVPARDVERDDDPVARLHALDLAAHVRDDSHRLVPEDIALLHERGEHLVEVQVRAADPARGHLDDHVRRLLDRRIRDLVHPHVALAVPDDRLHRG